MQQWIVPAVIGALALLVAALGLLLARGRSRTAREMAAARAEAASLRAQVDEIERRLARSLERGPEHVTGPHPADAGYVITRLGRGGPEMDEEVAGEIDGQADASGAVPEQRIDRALFADLVLRETVVRAASLTHGLRRALAPETRNRIRFEMRRELKRARKQRRADLREARRDLAARQRRMDAA